MFGRHGDRNRMTHTFWICSIAWWIMWDPGQLYIISLWGWSHCKIGICTDIGAPRYRASTACSFHAEQFCVDSLTWWHLGSHSRNGVCISIAVYKQHLIFGIITYGRISSEPGTATLSEIVGDIRNWSVSPASVLNFYISHHSWLITWVDHPGWSVWPVSHGELPGSHVKKEGVVN